MLPTELLPFLWTLGFALTYHILPREDPSYGLRVFATCLMWLTWPVMLLLHALFALQDYHDKSRA